MALRGIHCCSKLTAENLELKKKYHRIKQQKDELQRRIGDAEGKGILQRNSASKKSVYVQTEPSTRLKSSVGRLQPSRGKTKTPPKPDPVNEDLESEKMMKMLSMQNQLMKRYEREVKQNMDHLETITQLNGKIAQLESKLQKDEEDVLKLKKELFRIKGPNAGNGPTLKEVTKERNKLKKENTKLQTELEGLDQGFFDEVEDIKYALQQSAKLNQEYDKVLRKMCKNYGVPFPRMEKVLDS